jgi:hypothetical protein
MGLVRHRGSRLLAGIVAVAVGWLGLAAPAAAGTTPVTYDGEAMVRGLLYGLGPVAAAHPVLVYAHVEPTPENLDRVDDRLAAAKQRDPRLLDRFAVAMYSDDLAVVSRAALETMAALHYHVVVLNNSGQVYLGDEVPVAGGRPQSTDPRFGLWVRLVVLML